MNALARPTVSVALCTYNGEAYLPEQWRSLLEQQQLPDELVICDDRSTDGTVALLKQLATNAPFPVKILVNEIQLGSNKNFERALSQCTSDLIFICDQDDFWLPTKISTMVNYMASRPDVQVAFCDAWVTDEHLQERMGRFWEQVRFDKTAQQRWEQGEEMDVLLDGNRVMGCATVLRRELLNEIIPVPTGISGYIYDGWIGLIAAAHQTIQFIDQPLQLYRTHSQQQIGIREEAPPPTVRVQDRFSRNREHKLAPLRSKQELLSLIGQQLSDRVGAKAPGLLQLRQRLAHYTMRSTLRSGRLLRIAPVLTSFFQGNYHRYADASANRLAPYLAALGDILE